MTHSSFNVMRRVPPAVGKSMKRSRAPRVSRWPMIGSWPPKLGWIGEFAQRRVRSSNWSSMRAAVADEHQPALLPHQLRGTAA